MFDSFGNKVKIKTTPETEEKGFARKLGEIYGETTPSMIDFEIIGTPKEDYVVNVYFDDLKESFWFDAELLDFIDNGEGTVITLEGIDKRWTKEKDGEWIEEVSVSLTKEITKTKSSEEIQKSGWKWWQFWKL